MLPAPGPGPQHTSSLPGDRGEELPGAGDRNPPGCTLRGSGRDMPPAPAGPSAWGGGGGLPAADGSRDSLPRILTARPSGTLISRLWGDTARSLSLSGSASAEAGVGGRAGLAACAPCGRLSVTPSLPRPLAPGLRPPACPSARSAACPSVRLPGSRSLVCLSVRLVVRRGRTAPTVCPAWCPSGRDDWRFVLCLPGAWTSSRETVTRTTATGVVVTTVTMTKGVTMTAMVFLMVTMVTVVTVVIAVVGGPGKSSCRAGC